MAIEVCAREYVINEIYILLHHQPCFQKAMSSGLPN